MTTTYITYDPEYNLTSCGSSSIWEGKSVSQIEMLERKNRPYFTVIGKVLQTFPIKNWSEPKDLGDLKIQHKDGAHEIEYQGSSKGIRVHGSACWVTKRCCFQGNPTPLVAGNYCYVSENYYTYYKPKADLEGHDICLYCGTDNGYKGELRQGFDCFYCGGN
jgi:hypothetical protein